VVEEEAKLMMIWFQNDRLSCHSFQRDLGSLSWVQGSFQKSQNRVSFQKNLC